MTLIAGLVGNPIAHSRSPSLHNKWFKKCGIDARYELFEILTQDDLESFLGRFLLQPQSLGLNITVPYKNLILGLGVPSDDTVTGVDAANTLYRAHTHNGYEWRLANTDVFGFIKSVEQMNIPIRDVTTVILGAGGGAKAAVAGAYRLGCKRFKIFCRDRVKTTFEIASQSLPDFKIELFESLPQIHISTANVLIVNTLPLGHHSEHNPYASLAFESLVSKAPRQFFLDLVYTETPAVIEARSRGLVALNGWIMLVEQAKASFQLWTGQTPG